MFTKHHHTLYVMYNKSNAIKGMLFIKGHLSSQFPYICSLVLTKSVIHIKNNIFVIHAMNF